MNMKKIVLLLISQTCESIRQQQYLKDLLHTHTQKWCMFRTNMTDYFDERKYRLIQVNAELNLLT